MKTLTKRIVSVVLALTMLVCALSVAASAATTTSVKRYSVYVNLGDSIASGFGLSTDDKTPKTIVANSYGARIAYAVQADYYYAYAQRGYRTTEIRMLLDSSYEGDSLIGSREALEASDNYTTAASLNKQRGGYQKAVKQADLITLDVGFNDLWIPMQHMVNSLGDNLLTGILTYPATLIETVWQWVPQFMINYSAIVSKLVELNPDATIVLVGSYNPCAGWTLPADGGLPFGAMLTPIYTAINAYKQLIASQYDNVSYIDVSDVEIGSSSTPDLSLGGFEPHPTVAGHKYMANQILSVLPTGSRRSSSKKNLTKTRIQTQTVRGKKLKSADRWVVLTSTGAINTSYTGYAYNKNGKYYVKYGVYKY